MSDFIIDTSSVTFKDQDDNILVEGSLLDLHYTCADMARIGKEEGKTNKELYTEVAAVFKNEFQPNGHPINLSWATAMNIAIEIQKKIGDEKKS